MYYRSGVFNHACFRVTREYIYYKANNYDKYRVSQHGVRFDSAATTSTRSIDLAAFPFDECAPRKHCTVERSRLKEMVHLSQPMVAL